MVYINSLYIKNSYLAVQTFMWVNNLMSVFSKENRREFYVQSASIQSGLM